MSQPDEGSFQAYVSRPAMAWPEHEVTLQQIHANIAETHAEHPRLGALLRIVSATAVERRRFTRPLDKVATTETIAVRNQWAFEDLSRLGAQAAREVLQQNRLQPADIDCLVTSHSTGLAIPGLDVHLIAALGLPPTVRRIPMTQLGCAGGAMGLIRASDFVRAHPGSRVLVVCAEALSSIYQHDESTTDAMIYKALFGDGAGAVIVSSDPLGPGLRIGDSWEYTLPDSQDRYQLQVDGTGIHLVSTSSAPKSTGEVMPALLQWYGTAAGAELSFAVTHSGGPRILDDMDKFLGDGGHLTRHARASLTESGNLGGVAVFDALNRHHEDPPQDGSHGLVVGLGPGFTVAALRATWSTSL